MTYFGQALREGIKAAESAEVAEKEIEEIFKDLNEQIMEASDGTLSITKGLQTKAQSAFTQLRDIFSIPPEKYWAILASNPTVAESSMRQIAFWSQDGKGYPCRVSWGGQEHICEDKEALSNCLAELLRDPEVASTLRNIMNAGMEKPKDCKL